MVCRVEGEDDKRLRGEYEKRTATSPRIPIMRSHSPTSTGRTIKHRSNSTTTSATWRAARQLQRPVRSVTVRLGKSDMKDERSRARRPRIKTFICTRTGTRINSESRWPRGLGEKAIKIGLGPSEDRRTCGPAVVPSSATQLADYIRTTSVYPTPYSEAYLLADLPPKRRPYSKIPRPLPKAACRRTRRRRCLRSNRSERRPRRVRLQQSRRHTRAGEGGG